MRERYTYKTRVNVMNRYIPIIILGVIGYAIFSTCNVNIITWKDSDNLERIVITPKNSPQKSEIPPIPPNVIEQDNRLEKGEGPIAVGAYAVKSVMKMIPKDKKDSKEGAVSHQSAYPRKYSVGKFPEEEIAPPSLPEKLAGSVFPASDPKTAQISEASVSGAIGTSLEKMPSVPDMEDHDYSNPKVKRQKSYDDQILVASFNVDPWWEEDSRNSLELAEELASILVQFDLVAVQGFRIDSTRFLDDLVAHMAELSAGKKFHYVAAEHGGLRVSPNDPVLIFVYDTTTMEVDPRTISYLGKPNAPYKYRPLAAIFRTRKTSIDKAFTFVAVNVFLGTQRETKEFSQLSAIMDAARNIKATPDSPSEDDVLVFGHFGIEPAEPLPSHFPKTFAWSVFGRDTNAWGTFHSTTENICYLKDATIEADVGGVWNLRSFFQRKQGIPFDYHPVWLRLSIYEGGKP